MPNAKSSPRDPVDIAAIDLNYETNDAVETFGVTFQYQYFETNTTT